MIFVNRTLFQLVLAAALAMIGAPVPDASAQERMKSVETMAKTFTPRSVAEVKKGFSIARDGGVPYVCSSTQNNCFCEGGAGGSDCLKMKEEECSGELYSVADTSGSLTLGGARAEACDDDVCGCQWH